ncbi:MAG TPA: radical SAM family heme chaperone HemW, partial [Afifellaceae bacterium]|nr:radical SAM family heme chaperone HemW [Afifellaceae bacterium]
MSIETPPLSLYVHLPWCVRKCPYCDFNSHAAPDRAPFKHYVTALLADLSAEARRAGGRTIVSIYLGGGTPSLFSVADIRRILDAAHARLSVAEDCEVTMEVNPGTVERGDLAGFRDAGVNRVSLGVQSFDARMLKALGRIHGPEDVYAAFADALSAGFDSINIDLMFALPGQSLEAAKQDVAEACRLAPPHVSYYQLTLEPNTEFFKRPPRDLPDDELAWQIGEHCHALLDAAGYEQYEVSAFAKAGHRCRHNLNYWTFGDYLAIGAGAHGKFTDVHGAIWRYQKPAHPRSYIEQM